MRWRTKTQPLGWVDILKVDVSGGYYTVDIRQDAGLKTMKACLSHLTLCQDYEPIT